MSNSSSLLIHLVPSASAPKATIPTSGWLHNHPTHKRRKNGESFRSNHADLTYPWALLQFIKLLTLFGPVLQMQALQLQYPLQKGHSRVLSSKDNNGYLNICTIIESKNDKRFSHHAETQTINNQLIMHTAYLLPMAYKQFDSSVDQQNINIQSAEEMNQIDVNQVTYQVLIQEAQ